MENTKIVKETWRSVKDFEGHYEVSDNGSFRNNKGVVLSQYLHKNGYYVVSLRKNGVKKNFMSARLVAFAFPEICGEYFEGAQINHKNEIKTDNRATNLEWLSCRDNLNYGTHNKRMALSKAKPIIQYDLEGNFIKYWEGGARQVEKELGYSRGNINAACHHRKYSGNPYGHRWEFLQKNP